LWEFVGDFVGREAFGRRWVELQAIDLRLQVAGREVARPL